MTYGNSLVHVCTRTIVKGALLEARPCSVCIVFRSEVLVRRRTVSTCIYYWSASIVPVGSSPYDSGNAVQADNFAAPLPLQKDGATGQFSIRRIISYFLNMYSQCMLFDVVCPFSSRAGYFAVVMLLAFQRPRGTVQDISRELFAHILIGMMCTKIMVRWGVETWTGTDLNWKIHNRWGSLHYILYIYTYLSTSLSKLTSASRPQSIDMRSPYDSIWLAPLGPVVWFLMNIQELMLGAKLTWMSLHYCTSSRWLLSVLHRKSLHRKESYHRVLKDVGTLEQCRSFQIISPVGRSS